MAFCRRSLGGRRCLFDVRLVVSPPGGVIKANDFMQPFHEPIAEKYHESANSRSHAYDRSRRLHRGDVYIFIVEATRRSASLPVLPTVRFQFIVVRWDRCHRPFLLATASHYNVLCCLVPACARHALPSPKTATKAVFMGRRRADYVFSAHACKNDLQKPDDVGACIDSGRPAWTDLPYCEGDHDVVRGHGIFHRYRSQRPYGGTVCNRRFYDMASAGTESTSALAAPACVPLVGSTFHWTSGRVEFHRRPLPQLHP